MMTAWKLICLAPTTSTQVSKSFYLNRKERLSLLKYATTSGHIEEMIVLSTPATTQILYCSEKEATDFIVQKISDLKNQIYQLTNSIFRKENNEKKALTYFLETIIGTDPENEGDNSLLEIFKASYAESRSFPTMTGPYLEKLYELIIKLEQESNGPLDPTREIDHQTIDLVFRFVNQIKRPKIAIIGSNQAAKMILNQLLGKGYTLITVLIDHPNPFPVTGENQSPSIIQEPLKKIREVILENDVIINTLKMEKNIDYVPILEKNLTYKVFIDVIPNQIIDPNIEKLEHVLYLNRSIIEQAKKNHLKTSLNLRQKHDLLITSHLNAYLDRINFFRGNEILKSFKYYLNRPINIGPEVKNVNSQLKQGKEIHFLFPGMVKRLVKKSILKIKGTHERDIDLSYNKLVNKLFLKN